MKIYDCFTYFNEKEILELRLQYLNDIVDYFVIVEADMTHRGEAKEYNFLKIQNKFGQYLDKIRYIKLKFDPKGLEDDSWVLENAQRNGVMKGLDDCSSDDLILISDLDEIPSKSTLVNFIRGNGTIQFFTDRKKRLYKKFLAYLLYPEQLWKKTFSLDILNKTAVVCNQNTARYFLNYKTAEIWQGTILTKYGNLSSPQKLRDQRQKLPRLQDGGWHLTYMGGTDRILKKIKSIVEYRNDLTAEHIKTCLRNGQDIYGRKGEKYKFQIIKLSELHIPEIDNFIKKYPYLYF